MSIQSFKDLKVWQVGMDLTVDIYKLTSTFPKTEVYALSNQMQRAAVSVPSNISEGQGRDSTKEFLHFLTIALGSLFELETQLLLAGRLGYLDQVSIQPVLVKIDELGRMLRGLQKSLKAKL